MSYTWEKFHGAIHSLAATGTQKERLISVYVYNLSRLEPEDLPEEIQEDFRQFVAEITRVKGDEGSVKATVTQMSETEVSNMIDEIISMHDTVTRHQKPFNK